MESNFSPKRIAVLGHPKLMDALTEAKNISEYISAKGLVSKFGSLNDERLRKQVHTGEFDAVIAVGGDGTMLRASHLCAPHGIPVLGIYKGRLGFLFQVFDGGWKKMIDQLFLGEGWVESRMMLGAELTRAGEITGSWSALNDVVVSRGHILRPIHVEATVDGQYLTKYICDGVIASTATGSTAYALAAGGPVLPPELRNILLIPIAPHLSVDRAVVLSEGSTVSLTVLSDNTVMSIDGQIPINLTEDDIVSVHSGKYSAKFVRFGDPGYFYRNLTSHMNQNTLTGLPR
jgi:NAD+ kinase